MMTAMHPKPYDPVIDANIMSRCRPSLRRQGITRAVRGVFDSVEVLETTHYFLQHPVKPSIEVGVSGKEVGAHHQWDGRQGVDLSC